MQSHLAWHGKGPRANAGRGEGVITGRLFVIVPVKWFNLGFRKILSCMIRITLFAPTQNNHPRTPNRGRLLSSGRLTWSLYEHGFIEICDIGEPISLADSLPSPPLHIKRPDFTRRPSPSAFSQILLADPSRCWVPLAGTLYFSRSNSAVSSFTSAAKGPRGARLLHGSGRSPPHSYGDEFPVSAAPARWRPWRIDHAG